MNLITKARNLAVGFARLGNGANEIIASPQPYGLSQELRGPSVQAMSRPSWDERSSCRNSTPRTWPTGFESDTIGE